MDFLNRYSSQILGITRIIVGLLFLEHGLMKLVAFPAAMGTPPLPPLMLAAGIIEVVGGGLVTLGLFSRIAAFVCSGQMAAAYFMAHAKGGFWPIVNKGELAVVYCFAFLYIAARGAGPYSVDGMMRRKP